MNCSRFETLLSDYIEDALDPRVREALDQHLAGCEECTAMVAEVRAVQSRLADFPMMEPSEELLNRIILSTTGPVKVRRIWADILVPNLRPFLTQRFAFATAIIFVFLMLMSNVIGPDFSALSFSDFRPSALVEHADRFSGQVYKRWMQVKSAEDRLVGEIWRLKEDVYGRLDYHLINMLLRSYEESVEQGGTKDQKKEQQKK